MANIKSMKKDIKRNAKRHDRNTATVSALKTYVKKVRVAAAVKADDLDVRMKEAVSKIDKAQERGIIHKNTAARKKSRLMKLVNKSTTS
jgi:small subunit ribosomal protein S20